MNNITAKIQHLSPSAIRSYLDNPHAFKAKYIDGRTIFSDISPALIEGNFVHQIIDQYWSIRKGAGSSHEYATKRVTIDYTKLQQALEAPNINFGKTGSIEKSILVVENAVKFYLQSVPELFEDQGIVVEDTETTWLEDIHHPITGEILPFKLKGIVDLYAKQDGEGIIIDHKIVSAFSDPEKIEPKYICPAMFYYFLHVSKYGTKPKALYYDEIKKTKNRKGGPQVQRITIDFDKHNLSAMFYIFETICYELIGQPLLDENGIRRMLPNPFAQMGAVDVFQDFTQHIKYIF